MKELTLSDLNGDVHVACGFGLGSLCHFIFPCRPLHISPPLRFKGGRGFHFSFSCQQLVQAIAGDSGHGLAHNEELHMYPDSERLNPDPVVHNKLDNIMHTGCSVTNHLMMEA